MLNKALCIFSIVSTLILSGCATYVTAKWQETPDGSKVKLKCSYHSKCSSKHGDKEVTADSKFNVLQNIIGIKAI